MNFSSRLNGFLSTLSSMMSDREEKSSLLGNGNKSKIIYLSTNILNHDRETIVNDLAFSWQETVFMLIKVKEKRKKR